MKGTKITVTLQHKPKLNRKLNFKLKLKYCTLLLINTTGKRILIGIILQLLQIKSRDKPYKSIPHPLLRRKISVIVKGKDMATEKHQ